jgi:di/tricarboxylate transporter
MHPGIPLIGYLLDTRPMKDISLIMLLMGLLFGGLGLVKNKVGQLIGIAFLTVFRPLFYTAIS